MSKIDDVTRLRHMLDAAREAQQFASDKTRASLDQDRLLVLGIVKLVEIVGEAASKMTKAFQDAHPQIPWSAIIGMRNVLIHGYFEIDLDEVWSTLQKDLPPLIGQLEAIVPPIDDQQDDTE
jgi:uncharacterized protein with HEPN domain